MSVTLPYICGCFSYIMEKVDLVLLGAEGVAESGGIINKVGRCIPLKRIIKPMTDER